MADRHQHPTVMQKVAGQLHLSSSPSYELQNCYGGFQRPAMPQRHFAYANYCTAALQSHLTNARQARASPVCVNAHQRKALLALPLIFLWVEFLLQCPRLLLLQLSM
ncbi:hypothetical protein SLA2020_503090 [Shorea laevis]